MLAAGCSVFSALPPIEEFEVIGVPLHAALSGAWLGNADHDREPELIYLFSTASRLGIVDIWASSNDLAPAMRPLGEIPLESAWAYGNPSLGDIDGDGVMEILVSCRQDSMVVTRAYRLGQEGPVLETEPIFSTDKDGDGLYDTEDQTGVWELRAFESAKRGLCAFSCKWP